MPVRHRRAAGVVTLEPARCWRLNGRWVRKAGWDCHAMWEGRSPKWGRRTTAIASGGGRNSAARGARPSAPGGACGATCQRLVGLGRVLDLLVFVARRISQSNHRIGAFAKPVVALIDGICMGGGVGISAHGSHRVASERLVFAMPETGIGLFPDVGATHLLAGMEGGAGMWLALTGDRIGRDAARALGFVTHPVDSGRIEDALDRTAHARDLDAALDDLTVETEPLDPDETAVIDDAFSADSVAGVLDRLDARAGESGFAARAAAIIRTRSPTSLSIAFRQMKRAKGASLAECLVTDFRIVSRVLDGHDLYEGIRAVLIDKDNSPRWSPASLSGVDDEEIEAHFEPAPGGDLDLAEAGA